MQRVVPFLVLALFVVALVVAVVPVPRFWQDGRQQTSRPSSVSTSSAAFAASTRSSPPTSRTVTAEILEQTRTIIENRVNATGVAEPIVVTQGEDRISVELPGRR